MRANGVRGEVIATLAGADRRLCLTLGALAEIETALGCDGLTALADAVTEAPLDPRQAADAVAKAFAAIA